ncbi:hypothetical protein [Chelativorans sp. AA-79]|uniref:hypothetical protein n=1 Tax=Chelativorans sp. AA-79 TaxID=3028735 RepID=UPI0023F862DB|nr:hypothetical protein [Chelativorans sp. AA-79]WEX10744.1 hypothetical protein PVE73_07345 [Chelativorans sp. AA-79]
MMMKNLWRTGLAAGLLVAVSSGALAADWIETVEVSRDGIDIVPVEVSANAGGYVGVKSPSHKFLLRLYARATSGERIVAMKLGAFSGVLYFEGDGGMWSRSFKGRDVGSGSRRTVDFHHDAVVPAGKIKWQMADPVMACTANLQNKVNGGMSKTQVLSQAWTVSANAYFELDAVAARKNKAAQNKWNIGNTANQRDGLTYPVTVKCLPGIKVAPVLPDTPLGMNVESPTPFGVKSR